MNRNDACDSDPKTCPTLSASTRSKCCLCCAFFFSRHKSCASSDDVLRTVTVQELIPSITWDNPFHSHTDAIVTIVTNVSKDSNCNNCKLLSNLILHRRRGRYKSAMYDNQLALLPSFFRRLWFPGYEKPQPCQDQRYMQNLFDTSSLFY